MEKNSHEELKGWQQSLLSVILDPNNNCKQGAIRIILNSFVSSCGGTEITIVDRRQRIRIKDKIKMLPVSGSCKIEMLNKYIDDEIHNARIDKEALLEPWILIYSSEGKNNKKTSISLNEEDTKNILTKMMYDCLIEINDRHKILGLLIKTAADRSNELKKAIVNNKSVAGAPDGSGESYQVIDKEFLIV